MAGRCLPSYIVTIRSSGEYGGIDTIKLDLDLEIDGSGLIITRYRTSANPPKAPKIGLAYLLPKNVDRLTWERRALWSVYPEDHIGRPKGTALRMSAHSAQQYGKAPTWPWSQDMGNFFLFGKDGAQLSATNDFRPEEHVWQASCMLAGKNVCARVEALADVAVRACPLSDSRVLLSVLNFWTYPDLPMEKLSGSGKTTSSGNTRSQASVGKAITV